MGSAEKAEKSWLDDLRHAQNVENIGFLTTARPFPPIFHSVFHRCGNLGEETERRADGRCTKDPTDDARAL